MVSVPTSFVGEGEGEGDGDEATTPADEPWARAAKATAEMVEKLTMPTMVMMVDLLRLYPTI